MCILLCLGNSGLGHMMLRKEFPECLLDLRLREGDMLVRDRDIVVGEAGVVNLLARSSVKLIEVIHAEASGQLSCTIRTEIEEDDRIAILDRGNRLAILHHNRRNDELIGHPICIGVLHRLHAT